MAYRLLSISTLIFLACSIANASSARKRLPVATPDRFTIGSTWTWDYFDFGKDLYSSERYTVIAHEKDEIWIEMATRLASDTEYKAHHRLKVPVARCLAAYNNPVETKPWSFRIFFWNGKTWEETPAVSTLAFEEKFNCNAFVYEDSSRFETVFRESAGGRLFQQKKWRRLESSWFLFDGNQAGVAYEKEFKKENGGFFVMRLRRDSAQN